MNARTQAQDAVSWYFANLDVYSPNHENVRNYFRIPLVALTVNILQDKHIDYTSSRMPEEEKKASSDWREYLQPGEDGSAPTEVATAYASLSRRSKARMEAFLAGCSLAAPFEITPSNKGGDQQPSDLVSLQEGLSGFGITTKRPGPPLSSTISSVSKTAGNALIRPVANRVKHPQLQEGDLLVRLELYLRCLQRVKNQNEQCVVGMEQAKTIKARARYITQAFVATAGTVRNLRHVLARLLNCLTMELLAVEVLSEDTTKIIRSIVSEYEHGTSFASLAFLSTPEVNADSLLTPLVVKYIRYLQSNWDHVIEASELERMLTRALDPTMRKLFKTIEFRSIGHLLEVCHEQRSKLLEIKLAPDVCAVAENIHSLVNSKEAVKQALRDLQREVITVNGHVLPPVTSRKELLNILSQTLNARTLTAAEKVKRKPKKPLRRHESAPKTSGGEESDYLFSSEAESGMSDAHDDSSLSENNMTPPPVARKNRRRNFHLSTVDLLTRRLLIAASRTGNGGDALFVVRDLFGGEDVEVVPTNTLPLQGRMVRPGTIDILVRLASVTIKCHQSFDIYPKSLVGECEPLVQFHTTTTETINLQEVRSLDFDSSEEASGGTPDRVTSDPNSAQALLVVKEHKTSQTGWRTISVRPAIYEKVEVWGTPS